MSDTQLTFEIVRAGPEHVQFLAHSWMRSWRTAPEFRVLSDDIYYEFAKRHIASVLQACDGWVVVDEFHPDVVVGYLLYSDNVLEWTYIRRDFRGLGLYKRMKEKVSKLEKYSHRSQQWRGDGLEYRPWWLG